MKKLIALALVVTDACTKAFICASECATCSIHHTADESAASLASQVYINPEECIDCGNCVSVCPSGAIFSGDELPSGKTHFLGKNAVWFN